MVVTMITYDCRPPGAESPDPYPIAVRVVESGEEVPQHSLGEIVRLLDRRPDVPTERSFRVVGLSPPTIAGFVDTGFSTQYIHVVVADAE